MSLAEAAAAPSIAIGASESPASSPHKRLPRRRLDLIYFALAGMDLLTILFTLLLSNHIVTLYQQSVGRSAVWSDRVSELVELAQFAQEANAPGNDVFDSHDVARERDRRDRGLHHYERQRDEVLSDLARTADGDDHAIIVSRIRTADHHMDEMMLEADRIFAEIEAGRDEAAARRMATMDRVYARLTRSLQEAIIQVQEVEDANLERQVRLAGQLRSLEFVVMALILLIVTGVVLYGRRIGRVMRATEDAHNAMLSELETANESLEQYADNVAHELRSPVNKMLLESELTLSRARTAEEYQDACASIMEECHRLSSIVGSLLFLARARRTRVDIERQKIDVGGELDLIRSYFEAPAQEAGLELRVEAAPPLTLDADRTLFQRAISNLVSNAISHTPAGGKISIAAQAVGDRIVIEVSDTGEGMPAEAQERVFDRFFRADRARTATSGRIGLGLSITKSILDLHGGSVTLRSRVGEGTSIALSFPTSPRV
jgi:two-component system, OmpR family, heavy metal sensor histidine kinase CusS